MIGRHNISSILPTKHINSENSKSNIYAGYEYPKDDVENLVNKCRFSTLTQKYDPNFVDPKKTTVDSFLMKGSIAKKISLNRIKKQILKFAKDDVRKRVKCDHISITVTQYYYDKYKMKSVLFPVYTLQYRNSPPRIMAALRHQEKVSGTKPVSSLKVMAASIIPSLIISLAIPETIIVRVFIAASIFFGSGLITKISPYLKNKSNNIVSNRRREKNNLTKETLADKNRRIESEQFISYQEKSFEGVLLNIDPEHYRILKLSPDGVVTEIIIRQAFIEQMKMHHPDIEGDSKEIHDKATKITTARDVLLKHISK